MKSLFTPQPPWTFTLGMSIYHLLPFHAPITLFLTDAPFGRFASDSKLRWQMDGNKSWFFMEIVSPLTLLATLYFVPRTALPTSSTILTSLFLVHYLHRAVLSPLVYSPARSKQHVIVPIIAGIYNLLNGHCIAIGLSHYGSNSLGPRYWLSVAGWAIGFAGNVYHDEVLNDLRRPTEKQLFTTAHPKELEKDKEVSGGRYAIPRGGLFKYVSFPNYSCEWFEWLCFSMAAAPNPLILTPAISTLPEWLQQIFASTYYPSRLLHPSWMFFIFLLSSMYPRAVRSHRWYKEKFGDRYPDRKVVIPFVL